MISFLKDCLLSVEIMNIFKQIACQTNLSINSFSRGFGQPNTSYSSNTCPAFNAGRR